MKITKIFVPQYYKDFQCTGSSCSNNCCHDWAIDIDLETYERYKSLSDSSMRELLINNIKIDKSDSNKICFRLDENKHCKFLSEDGLCHIQTHLGHDYLSKTCKQYPRIGLHVGGEIEHFMSLSCEEVANLALFNENIMRFEELYVDLSNLIINRRINPSDYLHENATNVAEGFDLFWTLRNLSIFIMQNRKYNISQRLILLGLFIQQSERLLNEEKYEQINEFADDFMERVNNDSYNGFFQNIPCRPNIYLNVLVIIIEALGNNPKDPLFNCIKQTTDALCLDVSQAPDLLYNKLNEIINNHYQPLFHNKDFIYENYIVNHIFISGFPFTCHGHDSIFRQFLKLAIRYCVIRFLLIGMAGYHKQNLNKEHIIKVFSNLSRNLDHDSTVINEIIKFLDSCNMGNMGGISVLLVD